MKEVRIQVATARKNFAKVLARAAKSGERIKVVRYRTTLAGIVPGRDLERLDECEDVMKGRAKKKASASARSTRPAGGSKKTASRRTRPTTRSSKKRTSSKAKQARK